MKVSELEFLNKDNLKTLHSHLVQISLVLTYKCSLKLILCNSSMLTIGLMETKWTPEETGKLINQLIVECLEPQELIDQF